MTELDFDKFWGELVKAYPKWTCTDKERSIWRKKLDATNVQVLINTIDEYFANNRFKEPNLKDFRDCLQVAAPSGSEQKKASMAQFIITREWVKKLVAVDVKRARYGSEIMSRLDEWRGIYYWPYQSDDAHIEMVTIAQTYCQRLDRMGAKGWFPVFDRTWSELTQEKCESGAKPSLAMQAALDSLLKHCDLADIKADMQENVVDDNSDDDIPF